MFRADPSKPNELLVWWNEKPLCKRQQILSSIIMDVRRTKEDKTGREENEVEMSRIRLGPFWKTIAKLVPSLTSLVPDMMST